LSSSPIEKAWFSVPRFALPSASSYRPPLIQGFLNGLPAMFQVEGRDHFPSRVIDQSDACRLAPWIYLDSQWFHLWVLYRCLEDHSKWVSSIHRRLSLLQQEPRIP
jgi:hypothetical protein